MKRLRQLFSRRRGLPGDPAPTAIERSFDPYEPGFVQDPYPMFDYLREHQPVHRGAQGAWVITRYADIVAALADPRLGNAPSPYAVVNSRNRHRYVCADVANNILPFLDPPDHGAPRRLVARVFSEHLRQQPVPLKAVAAELLRGLRDRAEVELLEDFATPYSVLVMIRLLGLPESDAERLKCWSENFFYLFSLIPSEQIRVQLDRALAEFREYLAEQLAQRRQRPGSDLMTALLVAEDEGYRLSEAQLIDTCMLLFADGVENVDSMIATALAVLLQHPEQLSGLQAQPELIGAAVDELLRFESPAQFVGRVALEDLELHGTEIKQGSGVLLLMGAANRDPLQFPDAARLDIQRSPNVHLSFGRGAHSCIGGPLVRRQVESALLTLLESAQFDLLEDRLHWQQRLGHRWLQALPLGCRWC